MTLAPLRPDDAALISRQAELFDTPRHAVIGTTVDGEIVYWNEGAERIYGWSADEVEGRSILDVTPTNMSRLQAASIMTRLQLGHSWSGTFTVVSRSGEEFNVTVCDLPVWGDGELIGLVGVSIRSLELPESPSPRNAGWW
jgi:PAS domain S-box-containing protein